MLLFNSSATDGGDQQEEYVLAAAFQGGTLVFQDALVPYQRVPIRVDGRGTMCVSNSSTGAPTLYFRDGGVLSMTGVIGNCSFVSNEYWGAFGQTGYVTARMNSSQATRVPGLPSVSARGIDDNGVVVVSESTGGGYFGLKAIFQDGGALVLSPDAGPSFMSAETFATQGVLAGRITYAGLSDYAAWRLDGVSAEPFVRYPSQPLGQVHGVSQRGDMCGVFFGRMASFVAPIGYGRLIEAGAEIPELAGLECRGLLDDGVFFFVAPAGEPRRFGIARIRKAP